MGLSFAVLSGIVLGSAEIVGLAVVNRLMWCLIYSFEDEGAVHSRGSGNGLLICYLVHGTVT